jgi:hypothetical protein
VLDRPLDPYLPAEGIPVKEQRSARVGNNLAALAAVVVREEDEAPSSPHRLHIGQLLAQLLRLFQDELFDRLIAAASMTHVCRTRT